MCVGIITHKGKHDTIIYGVLGEKQVISTREPPVMHITVLLCSITPTSNEKGLFIMFVGSRDNSLMRNIGGSARPVPVRNEHPF